MPYDGGTAAPALSFGDLETLWTDAGGPAAVAPIAAAIAQAESGGISNNFNPTDPLGNGTTQTAWGIWQLGDGTHNAPANWSDPATNAALAVAKYKAAGGFKPWGTYTAADKPFLPFLQDAIANGATSAGAAASALGSGSALGAGAAAAPASTPSTFTRTALSSATSTLIIVFAALVLLIGIWATTRSSTPAAAVAA